jgi:hypothetical protein|uniref:Uncharacterized protein n=1 Tax=viral metagenome TaxID=1070528 RepID=A0A6C0HDW6_9ZZZZ
MQNIFLIAGVISVIFFIVKFIEMRFVDKESKPLKFLIRDSLLVYFSVIAGNFIMEQLKPVIQEGGEAAVSNPVVFTDNPGF